MTKLDKLKHAEHMYVYEKQPLDVISTKLDLSRRILFYWKKNTSGIKNGLMLNTTKTDLAKSYLVLQEK